MGPCQSSILPAEDARVTMNIEEIEKKLLTAEQIKLKLQEENVFYAL